ncbi:MAG: hypothetical protein IT313_06060 [Anaerolineales bacterium]|nr:hypothetical protein [Anaerolineales bacterium]
MKKFISLIVTSILLAACAPQATVTPTAVATLTATSAPTETPIPTPTLHPNFIALQEAIAASGERFTLDGATGLIYDGENPIPGITVSADGTITLEIDGETITPDPDAVNFDDQEGITVEDNERILQWGADGWAETLQIAPFTPEVQAALDSAGLVIAPEDLCLWDDTQCMGLNVENIPLLADNLREMTNTIAWLGTWSASDKTPGKYPTLASYEAMLASAPLQQAAEVDMAWRPNYDMLLPTKASFQPASEWIGPDGKRIGNDAVIDMTSVGLVIVDWEVAQKEGGYTRVLAGGYIKQTLVPVEGKENTFRVVWRISDKFSLADFHDADGNGIDDYGLIYPDKSLAIADNVRAWNQVMNWLKHLMKVIQANPKYAVWNTNGKIIQFASEKVVLNKEIMDEMAEGAPFFEPAGEE